MACYLGLLSARNQARLDSLSEWHSQVIFLLHCVVPVTFLQTLSYLTKLVLITASASGPRYLTQPSLEWIQQDLI